MKESESQEKCGSSMKRKRVLGPGVYFSSFDSKRLTPGLDNTRLFMRLTAGAGT